MSSSQIDAIVDEVARRVQARLSPTKGSCTLAAGQAPSTADCDNCRGCHVHRPNDVRNIVQLGAHRIAAGAGNGPTDADLAPYIDHTLLKPQVTKEQLKVLCDEAKRYGFATVCVNAVNVRYCAAQLSGSSVVPIAVVGFPLGASTPGAKAFETREAVRNGAQEIDTVINIGALKDGDYGLVLDDIAAVVAAASPKPVKVILETAMLDDEQKVIACALSRIAGAAFVKTSTGFGPGGATAEDVTLMRRVVGSEMGVKASGGMRTADDVRKMVAAGANRIGASASVAIVSGTSGKAKGSSGRPAAGGY